MDDDDVDNEGSNNRIAQRDYLENPVIERAVIHVPQRPRPQGAHLVRCPECGTSGLSAYAETCPDCQFPMGEWRRGIAIRQARKNDLRHRSMGSLSAAIVFAGYGALFGPPSFDALLVGGGVVLMMIAGILWWQSLQ